MYDAVGGMPFFERLVDAFYTGVASDDVLLPLYPEAPDLQRRSPPPDPVPRPVLGRSDHLQRRAWPPTSADAAHALPVGPLQRDRWLPHMGPPSPSARRTAEIADDADGLLRAGGRAACATTPACRSSPVAAQGDGDRNVRSARGTASSRGRASRGTRRGPPRPRRSRRPGGSPRRRTPAGRPGRRRSG